MKKISKNDLSESAVLNLIKLEASQKGARLWRNNVGGTYTSNGDFIRFGLANESHQINQQIKSGDLIGIYPQVVTQDMVGKIIGQFISREIKKSIWKFNKNCPREQAQQRWIDLINSLGGDACFVTNVGSLT